MKFLPARKRGMMAVTAMIMLSIMVVTALSTAELAILQVRGSRNMTELQQARHAALTGIDLCVYLTNSDPDWRTRLGSGQWVGNYAVGKATVSVRAEPVGGSINDPASAVLFTAEATSGPARQRITAQAAPQPALAMNYLLANLANKKMELGGSVRLYGDVRTNGRIDSDGTVTLIGNIYTTRPDHVDPSLIDGDTEAIAAVAIESPPVDPAWYRDRAQHLVLPTVGGKRVISSQMLTDTVNPFGPANPEGLYYVSLNNQHVVLENSYVVGTLVFDGAHTVTIKGGYRHRPASNGYPAIISTGRLTIEIEDQLREAVAMQDFNGDGDMNDVFMSRIDGLLYAGGRFTGFVASGFHGEFRMHGAIIAEEIRIEDGRNCYITYDPELANTLIPGFHRPGLAFVPGTMR